MEPDRELGRERETREAIAALRAAIEASAPIGGRRLLREAIAAERRRERGRGLGLAVMRLAAVLAMALGGFLFWRQSISAGDTVVCPHGTSVGDKAGSLPESLRVFLENPDNFQRVCHCQPRYSGSLR